MFLGLEIIQEEKILNISISVKHNERGGQLFWLLHHIIKRFSPAVKKSGFN